MNAHATHLSELLRDSGVQPLSPLDRDPLVRGAAIDSRRVEIGDIFFAVRGFTTNGEEFVGDAIGRGACAIVASTPRPVSLPAEVGWIQVADVRRAAGPIARSCYGRPDERLTLVGVTGTNGKTTVTHLIESIAGAAGRRCGRIGTMGSSAGGRQQELDRTTPEAPDLFRLLARMEHDGIEVVAMEVSSHALALSRVEGARFHIAAFLNLSSDHLDFHRDEESYFLAKARLFESLERDSVAVLHADDGYSARLAQMTRARVMTFGGNRRADVRLLDQHIALEGSSAILDTEHGRLPLRSFLLGPANMQNVAAAATCAIALSYPPESIPEGVLRLEQVPGRLERVDGGQPYTVLVDYAHTPAALEGSLTWLRSVTEQRLFVVFGCGGARDRTKRPLMGEIAARLADRIYLTSDNPRDEPPEQILDEIEAGVRGVAGGGERSLRTADREQAIRAAVADAQPGDVVLIAGKGHETTQTAGDETRPFDDRVVALAAIRDQGNSAGA